jgi:hypothetical protein
MFVKSDNIPLIKPFLLNVQSQNKREVNNALNDLLIEEEDYKTLRDSVNNHDNYDPVTLAQRLEKHDLIFFRQIAADIYRKNKRWEKSIALSKQDKLFKDAIETSAMSSKPEIIEDLLRYVSISQALHVAFTLIYNIVCRYWQPRVLRWHALRLLRPDPSRCNLGDVVAQWSA